MKRILSMGAGGLLAASAAGAARPNIVHIVVDDLGFSDIGAYGGEIETPHLDRLAREGLRFAQFYDAAKCEPSRASLMSGLYWTVAKLGAKEGITLGEAMRAAGYATCAVGKWHLDGNPVDRGFDRYFGHLGGFSPFYPPLSPSFHLDRKPFKTADPDFYATDAFTDFAIGFIEAAADKPFYIYLAYNAPHNPLQAPREEIMRYRGKYLEGWDKLRGQRHARQVAAGLFDPAAAPLSPRPQNVPAWDSLSPEQQDLEDLRMSVYAAMVDRVDQNIGRILHALEGRGVARNTLVFFMSDNGASPYWRTDEAMLRNGKLPGDRGSNWEIGLGWANASNTPFRLYKRNQHEGGIATPLVAWWPDGIRNGGRWVRDPSHIIDIMPTLIELAGGTYPAESRGRRNPPLPGKSLAPLFRDEPRTPHEALYFLLYDHAAVRAGDWKLARVDGLPWELFDLAKDRTETRDLAVGLPETVQRLEKMFDDWLAAAGMRFPHDPTPRADRRDDRGGGLPYVPSAMPDGLRGRYPLPRR